MARVADVVLEKLKRDVSVRRLAEVKGVVFKKSGDDNFLGHCPFHEDKTPSFFDALQNRPGSALQNRPTHVGDRDRRQV